MVRTPVAMTRCLVLAGVMLIASGCAPFADPQDRPRDPAGTATAGQGPEVDDSAATEAPAPPDDGIETAAYTPPEPEPLEQRYPRSAGEVSGPAVSSLYRQAQSEADAGRHASAIAVLERAQRIEPRNAFVWSRLAEAQLAAGDAGQAENTALRANSFARGNPYLEARNWRVIADARRSAGDQAGARAAVDRVEQARLRQSGG